MVHPLAFYTLVAEFEARGFDSTTTPESGIRAQVLRLSSFCDISVAQALHSMRGAIEASHRYDYHVIRD